MRASRNRSDQDKDARIDGGTAHPSAVLGAHKQAASATGLGHGVHGYRVGDRFVCTANSVLRQLCRRGRSEGTDRGRHCWARDLRHEGPNVAGRAVLSRYWGKAVKAAGVRYINLHAARYTCATLMYLQGVPAAVIAQWIRHKDASLTMRLYAHSQNDALKAAGESLNQVVTFGDTGRLRSNGSNII